MNRAHHPERLCPYDRHRLWEFSTRLFSHRPTVWSSVWIILGSLGGGALGVRGAGLLAGHVVLARAARSPCPAGRRLCA